MMQRAHTRRLPLLLAVGFGIAGLLATGAVAWVPRADTTTFAAVFPPGYSTEAALLAVVGAGGLPLAQSPVGRVVIARAGQTPLADALYRAGALLVLAADGLRGCGNDPTLRLPLRNAST